MGAKYIVLPQMEREEARFFFKTDGTDNDRLTRRDETERFTGYPKSRNE